MPLYLFSVGLTVSVDVNQLRISCRVCYLACDFNQDQEPVKKDLWGTQSIVTLQVSLIVDFFLRAFGTCGCGCECVRNFTFFQSQSTSLPPSAASIHFVAGKFPLGRNNILFSFNPRQQEKFLESLEQSHLFAEVTPKQFGALQPRN